MNKNVETKLDNIVAILEQAIRESESALNDDDKGYPYAAGYSRSALKDTLKNIHQLQTML